MCKVVVVIPVHDGNPSEFELISFRQCFRILYAHTIIIIVPKSLDISVYQAIVPDVVLNLYRIEDSWFASKAMYNKLKLSRYFYNLFPGYEFLLTYELDAFVFEDRLSYWCGLQYDFVGAPWFKNFGADSFELDRVGNSGFSLRKISAVKKLLPFVFLVQGKLSQNRIINSFLYRCLWLINFLRSQFWENPSIQSSENIFEDFVLTQKWIFYPQLRLPSAEKASTFSFEVHPSVLYNANGNILPMGCHAWWRYDLDFWRPFINQFGYSV